MQNRKNSPDTPDFLNDEKFIAWRLYRTPELNNHWSAFRKEHPEYHGALDRAIEQFKFVRLNERFRLDEEQRSELWERIRTSSREQRRSGRRMLLWRLSAAASIALVLVSTLYFATHRPEVQPAAPIVGERFPEENIRLHTGREVVTLAQDAEIVVDNRGRISVAAESTPVVAPASKTKDNKLVVPYGKRATRRSGSTPARNSSSRANSPVRPATSRSAVKSTSKWRKTQKSLSASTLTNSTSGSSARNSTSRLMPTTRSAPWCSSRERSPLKPEAANRWKWLPAR